MAERTGKSSHIFTIFALILYQVADGQDFPVVKGMESNIPNTAVPFVYMAETSITVGEIGLNSVPISIFQSEAVAHDTYINVVLSYHDRRRAYLGNSSPYIPAFSTNTTAYLFVDKTWNVFFTQDSVYNVTITDCGGDCEVGSPQSAIIAVKPETNVTVSFAYMHASFRECECDGCCYNVIRIRSSMEMSADIVIPLVTGSNDTATYNEDYSFDEEFVEAQLSVNLSVYSNYQDADLYVIKDGRLEGTEFFHLRFDTNNLPDRVIVGSPGEMRYEIYDSDYGKLRLNDSNRQVSEDVGTIELIVETNIIQPDKNLTLNVTIYHLYTSAKAEEDYIPFDGFYVIPPGASSTVIPITLIDDDLAENEERIVFKVEVYFKQTDQYFSIRGRIAIEDDETSQTPLLFFFDKTSITVNESSGTLDFYVRSNIKNEGFVYLQYIPGKENGLMEYHDYTAFFNATIKQHVFQFEKDMEYKIEVNVLNDCDVEATEMMVLNISDVTIGQVDPVNYNLTIMVEDNDEENDLDCLACSCGGGMCPTEKPTSGSEPESLMFNFELDEIEIYEGKCSFYNIDVVATKPTSATVFIGIQPWELKYGEDFTISAKKLVFENNDRQTFSFRALQDTMDEGVESALIYIAYVSDGMIGRRNAILVHVLNKNVTSSG